MRDPAKVLIVDDEEGVRQVVAAFFQRYGCQVFTARDGLEGVEQVRQQHFDLIILDLNMPRMNGMEALPVIHEADPEARVVILTGYGSYESKVEAREKGVYDYLLKPVSVTKLKEVADRALPERRQMTDRRQTGDQPVEGISKVRLPPGKVDPVIAREIPERIARVFSVVALAKKGDTLTVAMVDPFDLVALDTLNTQIGYQIKPVPADRYEIMKAIDEVYRGARDTGQGPLDTEPVPSSPPVPAKPEPVVPVHAPSRPAGTGEASDAAVQWVNLILLQAVQSRASDIHLEPWAQSISVRLRIDGMLHEINAPSKQLFLPIISRIKQLAGLDVAECRIPQDRRVRMPLEEQEADFRIMTLPTMYGESVVIHLIDERPGFSDINMLGFDASALALFVEAIQRPQGMVCLTGPKGSGKTTALYAALQTLNSRQRKIITVEDPVEYEVEGINQVSVRADLGLTFASTLRAAIRQNPDVILAGEIRDGETAELALQAALSGQLVLGALQTPDAPSSLTRLANLGLPSALLGTALTLIVAQRLVRRLCPDCTTEIVPPAEQVEQVRMLGVATIPAKVFTGAGCGQCRKTGYRGRVVLHEVLPITGRIRQALMQGAGDAHIRKEAAAMGYASLIEHGLAKAGQGVTTLAEVLSALSPYQAAST